MSIRRPGGGYNSGAQPPLAPGARPAAPGYPGAAESPAGYPSGYPQAPLENGMPAEADSSRSVHEANRVRKAVEQNVKAIENRIRFFQREEEKIWKDLEEVRRQASMIEEGRSRTIEKKQA